ncbi:MAG: response regulator transcription factor [Bacteroidota bacterium]
MIRVMILDDHRLLVDALRRMLNQEVDMEVVGVAHDRSQALALFEQHQIDVAVLDIRLGNDKMGGMELAEQLYESYPETQSVILTMHSEGDYIDRMLKSDIAGFILKEGAAQELVSAIRQVYDGGTYYSVDAMRIYTEYCRAQGKSKMKTKITKREQEVLQLVVDGLNNRQISALLKIGEAGVETHRRHIRAKLEVGNTAEMVREAILQKLVNINKYRE